MRHSLKGPLLSRLLAWFCLLAPAGLLAAPVFSEIVASNKTTLADADGDHSDWIEIHNPDRDALDLTGWFLTDNANNRTKWQFPAVSIPPGGFLVVFASDKNRRDPAQELHASFALSADGEYLGLIGPDGASVVSEFAPAFPALAADVAYGVDSSGRAGVLAKPTPGQPNSALGGASAVLITPSTRTFADTIEVSLDGAGEGEVIRYELVAPGKDGVEGDGPSADSPIYREPLVLSASTLVRAAVFSEDGSARGASAATLFVRTGDVTGFASRLPVLLLDNHGVGPLEKDQGKVSAWLQIFTPAGEDAAPVFDAPPAFATPIEMNVRGSTSAEAPKKSYSLELHDARGANRPTSLFGLATAADWALVSPWEFDPSYLRNAYAYALSNRLGRWAPRTQFVEVFFKTGGEALDSGQYAGLSVLTERIKVAPDLVAIAELDSSATTPPAVTGGYILKFDPRDDDEYGFTTDRGFPRDEGIGAGTMLVVAAPKADKLADAQRDYIRGYVQDFENALFADRDSGWATRRYLDFIDRDSWVDFHLLQVLTKNSDGLARSAYFTKDRGGKLQAGPVWDFDRAMGSTDARAQRWDEWYEPTQASPLWDYAWWGALTRDPDFMQAWIDRWQTLRAGMLSNENLVALAQSLAARIDPEAAARDAVRWPENAGRGGAGFAGEVDHLVSWLTQRAQWIDQQFLARPVEIVSGATHRIVAPPGLQIAYTLDGTDPRGPNGTVSPAAVLVADELLLENGTYTVRLYDPAAADVFPSSPWSALTRVESTGGSPGPGQPGPSFSPQLVNLATRGRVATGEPLVAGLAVPSGAAQRYLIRGIGPTLSVFGVDDALSSPVLRVLNASGAEIARNDDWRNAPDRAALAQATASVGAFALAETSRDAALLVTLAPGNYTIEVSTATGGEGTALAELYALEASGVVGNLSTRGVLARGESLIGGASVGGSAPRRLLIRAVGPSLAAFGVSDPLPDPTLSLYSGPTLLAANDDWTFAGNASEIATAAEASGAFALAPGSKDAALLLEVEPGTYTFQVRGKDEGGTTLLEVYDAR